MYICYMIPDATKLDERVKRVIPLLNEKQRRQYLAIESEIIGHGGLFGGIKSIWTISQGYYYRQERVA